MAPTDITKRNPLLPQIAGESIRILKEEGEGDYELGRGGSATVYKVEIRGKIYALKSFRIGNQDKVWPTNAIYHEALAIMGLPHPNIIKLLAISWDHHGLVLEYCEGGSLRKLLTHINQRTISISVSSYVDWALQIASAMEFIISKGNLHRDLKTTNILVKEPVCYCLEGGHYENSCHGKTPQSKLTMIITDFGIAKQISDKNPEPEKSAAKGTWFYMAPEVYRSSEYSEASDVWSFGVVLWEILTQRLPYSGERLLIYMLMGMESQLTNDSVTTPPKWKEMMKRCSQPLPEFRPTFSEIKNFFTEYKSQLQDSITLRSEERNLSETRKEAVTFMLNPVEDSHLYDSIRNSIYRENYIEPIILPVGLSSLPTKPPKNLEVKKESGSFVIKEIKHLVHFEDKGNGTYRIVLPHEKEKRKLSKLMKTDSLPILQPKPEIIVDNKYERSRSVQDHRYLTVPSSSSATPSPDRSPKQRNFFSWSKSTSSSSVLEDSWLVTPPSSPTKEMSCSPFQTTNQLFKTSTHHRQAPPSHPPPPIPPLRPQTVSASHPILLPVHNPVTVHQHHQSDPSSGPRHQRQRSSEFLSPLTLRRFGSGELDRLSLPSFPAPRLSALDEHKPPYQQAPRLTGAPPPPRTGSVSPRPTRGAAERRSSSNRRTFA